MVRLAEVEAPFRFDFAAQADMLVTSDWEETLHLWQWQFETFTEIATFRIPPDMYGGSLLAISPDGQYIALSGEDPDPRIAVWSKDVEAPLYFLNSSRRSDYFAGVFDKSLAARPAFVSGPGRDYPSQLLFSPDSQQLAVATWYYDLTFWQVSDGTKIQEFTEMGEHILFHPTEAVIATWEYTISQWQIDGGTFINVLNQHIGPITDLANIPGAGQLAIASNDSYIYLRHMGTGNLFGSLKAGIDNDTSLSSPSVYSIDVTADGQTLVSASNDAYRVWDLKDYSMTTLAPRPRGDLGADEIAISSNGDYIVGAEYDSEIRFWQNGETEAGRLPLFSPGTVAFSRVSPLLATHSYFGSGPVLWEIETEQSIPLPTGDFEGLIDEFVFSADEQFLAASADHHTVLIWRIAGLQAELVRILSAGSTSMFDSAVAFSNNNQILAQSTVTYVRFWDMSDGSLLYTLDTNVLINVMVFSPDGDYLITGHWDGSVRFWAIP